MKVMFKILVFRGDSTAFPMTSDVHVFDNVAELARAMIGFAALNSDAKFRPEARHLSEVSRIQEPPIPGGLSPDTTLLISDVTIIED